MGHEVQETKKRGDVFVILILYSNRCMCFRYFIFAFSPFMLSDDRPQLCRVRGGVWESLFLGLNYNMRMSRRLFRVPYPCIYHIISC